MPRASSAPSQPTTKKPTPYLFREVTPNWHGFFSRLATIDITKPLQAIGQIPLGVWELLKTKPKSASEECFLLVKRALMRASLQVINDLTIAPSTGNSLTGTAIAQLDARLEQEPIELSAEFFSYPARSRIVGVTAGLLASWLKSCGVDPSTVDAAIVAFPAHFTSSLNAELRENDASYGRLIKQYSPSFDRAAAAESAWLEYHTRLSTKSNPTVLNLNISLDDVYVELRAFTTPKTSTAGDGKGESLDHREVRKVGMLTDMAQAWMEESDDAIFVLSGGPGAGKSAFARRFAAWRAWSGPTQWRVLYVPLHRFRVGVELKSSLTEFATLEIGSDASLFDPRETSPLLIVFDGLDELAQQGKVGEEAAADFFRQVDDFAKDVNRDVVPARFMVMICGRPVAVSNTNAELRRSERVRFVLPYFLPERDRNEHRWTGQAKLIAVDQRQTWWAKYGIAISDVSMKGMPTDVETDKLSPLTAEPILNGLIAQCRIKHKLAADTNRAMIYGWLLVDVLMRVHDASGKQHLKDASEDDISRLLEEVAVTAWHSGDVRATTKSKVVERCEKTDQGQLLNAVFPSQQKSQITSLFLAFYFQETGERIGQDQAFEFSHKSFGEYLLARRIVRTLREIHTRLADDAWDCEFSLKRWAELFGPTPLNDDITVFIRDLFELESVSDLVEWRHTIERLIGHVVKHGLPLHQLGLPNFKAMQFQSDNATVSLLMIHSICYRPGDDVVLRPPLERATLLVQSASRLLGISWRTRDRVLGHLNGLDLREMNLMCANLDFSNFSYSNLSDGYYAGSSFRGARLKGTNLSDSHLASITYSSPREDEYFPVVADLRGAVLECCNLTNTSLRDAVIKGANIEGAILTGTGLTLAQLRTTVGEPATMPNGKRPKPGWREKKERKK